MTAGQAAHVQAITCLKCNVSQGPSPCALDLGLHQSICLLSHACTACGCMGSRASQGYVRPHLAVVMCVIRMRMENSPGDAAVMKDVQGDHAGRNMHVEVALQTTTLSAPANRPAAHPLAIPCMHTPSKRRMAEKLTRSVIQSAADTYA